MALRRQYGLIINPKTVSRLMKALDLASKIRVKKFKTYKGECGKTVKNLLLTKTVDVINHKTYYKRDFSTNDSNQKWVTDITEFKVCGTKVYLSPLIDIYDKTIVSYQISLTPNLRLVVMMLEEAIEKYQPRGLIFHSDQGWHYKHTKIQRILKKNEITRSMSRKGNCYDNSLAENFFGIVKSEFYDLEEFKSVEAFIKKLKEYLEYYGNERISLKLKGMTPNEYRKSYLEVSS